MENSRSGVATCIVASDDFADALGLSTTSFAGATGTSGDGSGAGLTGFSATAGTGVATGSGRLCGGGAAGAGWLNGLTRAGLRVRTLRLDFLGPGSGAGAGAGALCSGLASATKAALLLKACGSELGTGGAVFCGACKGETMAVAGSSGLDATAIVTFREAASTRRSALLKRLPGRPKPGKSNFRLRISA